MKISNWTNIVKASDYWDVDTGGSERSGLRFNDPDIIITLYTHTHTQIQRFYSSPFARKETDKFLWFIFLLFFYAFECESNTQKSSCYVNEDNESTFFFLFENVAAKKSAKFVAKWKKKNYNLWNTCSIAINSVAGTLDCLACPPYT